MQNRIKNQSINKSNLPVIPTLMPILESNSNKKEEKKKIASEMSDPTHSLTTRVSRIQKLN